GRSQYGLFDVGRWEWRHPPARAAPQTRRLAGRCSGRWPHQPVSHAGRLASLAGHSVLLGAGGSRLPPAATGVSRFGGYVCPCRAKRRNCPISLTFQFWRNYTARELGSFLVAFSVFGAVRMCAVTGGPPP